MKQLLKNKNAIKNFIGIYVYIYISFFLKLLN